MPTSAFEAIARHNRGLESVEITETRDYYEPYNGNDDKRSKAQVAAAVEELLAL